MNDLLWTPRKERAHQSTLGVFSSWKASRAGKPLDSYDDLRRCSLAELAR